MTDQRAKPDPDAAIAGAPSFPIGAKLIVIISIVVLLSLGTITALVTYFVSNDVRLTAEDNNHTVNARSAAAAETAIGTIRANTFLLLDLMDAVGRSGALSRQSTSFFFERNQDIAAIIVTSGAGRRDTSLVNRRFFIANEIDESLVDLFCKDESQAVRRAVGGETLALNAAPVFDKPIAALCYPWKGFGLDQAVIILFSTQTLAESFGIGTANETFMINDRGDLLVHPDFDLVRAGVNFGDYPLVRAMRENNDENRQIMFKATERLTGKKIALFGAYHRLAAGSIGVLTTVKSDQVFEGVRKTTAQNLFLTLAVLSLAVLFIWFFSKSISNPLRRLTSASEEIENGNFAIELTSRNHDEIGLLTHRFVSMARGLAERERLKDTFGRFINKEIAEKAAKGELTLGGEGKDATIFFSDIRGFTAISEKLRPDEVVEFLNAYMTRMVTCVNQTHGVVDKFIGDAVMAVWGAPVSKGDPATDAFNCVRSALMMRDSLREFNEGRGGDKRPIIKIGCGINTGHVIAGQIGSHERMEYTVIGDAVNFASRAESLNKPLGTDILITENTYELIKDRVTVEEMPSVSVKGKEKPVRLFAVINMPGETDIRGAGPDGPKTMADVRERLGIPTPDYAKVDLDAEEKKYKIEA